MLDENAKIKGLKDISIIFNGVRPRGLVKSAYGFGYGYGYEYVYHDRSKAPQNNKK
jgi:tyrosine-protein kinase Etk/Wzc